MADSEKKTGIAGDVEAPEAEAAPRSPIGLRGKGKQTADHGLSANSSTYAHRALSAVADWSPTLSWPTT
jgi:hypothetical protein